MLPLIVALLITVSPIEQSYGPFAHIPMTGGHSIAVADRAMLLAWSEIDPATSRSQMPRQSRRFSLVR